MSPRYRSSGIPTMYKGVRYRSRLEARWAAFFDLLGWPYAYEPIDLRGYIPDFLLLLPHRNMLVEVKPELDLADLRKHAQKIADSGWKQEALIVGSRLFEGEFMSFDLPILGILCEHYEDGFGGDMAPLFNCSACNRPAFTSAFGSWECRVCGVYDKCRNIRDFDFDDAKALWNGAGNLTQWRAP